MQLTSFAWQAGAGSGADEPLRKLCGRVLAVLYERDSRRAFTRQTEWLIADKKLAQAFDKEVMDDASSERETRALNAMKTMPHVLPFERRVVSTSARSAERLVACLLF